MQIIIGSDGSGFDVAVEEAIAVARRYCMPLPADGLVVERRDGRPGGWLLSPGPWQRPERDARRAAHLDGPLTRKLARVGSSRAKALRCVRALRRAGVECEAAS
jgi:hypothetical protein